MSFDPTTDPIFKDCLVTPAKLKTSYLFGVPLLDPATNTPLPDSFLEDAIKAAYDYIYLTYDITVYPIFVEDERLDFYFDEATRSNFKLQFKRFPIVPLKEYPIKIEGFYGTNMPVFEYPVEWYRPFHENGSLHIYPTWGATSAYSAQFSAFTYLQASYRKEFIPGFFKVSYYAGFPCKQTSNGLTSTFMQTIIAKLASIQVMDIIGPGMYGFGVSSQSISIDGLSQSLSYSNSNGSHPLSGRVAPLLNQLKEDLKALKGRFGTPSLIAV